MGSLETLSLFNLHHIAIELWRSHGLVYTLITAVKCKQKWMVLQFQPHVSAVHTLIPRTLNDILQNWYIKTLIKISKTLILKNNIPLQSIWLIFNNEFAR